MAAFNYSEIRDETVIPLLAEFGQTATLQLPGTNTGPGYDPQPTARVEVPVTVIESDFTREERAGGNIEANDAVYTVSPDGVTADPQMADRLQVGDDVFQVTKVKPVSPGGTVLLWRVFVRK